MIVVLQNNVQVVCWSVGTHISVSKNKANIRKDTHIRTRTHIHLETGIFQDPKMTFFMTHYVLSYKLRLCYDKPDVTDSLNSFTSMAFFAVVPNNMGCCLMAPLSIQPSASRGIQLYILDRVFPRHTSQFGTLKILHHQWC